MQRSDQRADRDVGTAPPRPSCGGRISSVPTHALECDVRRELLATPGVRFSGLVVRRVDDGVCLQGVVHFEGDSVDIPAVIREITGVERVLDHLVRVPDPCAEPT